MAQYLPPLHNLSVFNPNDFPLSSSGVVDVVGLNQISQETTDNAATISNSSTLINGFNQIDFGQIATDNNGFDFGITYSIPMPTLAPANGVPFIIIINMNISTWTGGVSINSIELVLINTNETAKTRQIWNQNASNAAQDLYQKSATPQFVFTGIGNGYPFLLNLIVKGDPSDTTPNTMAIQVLGGGSSTFINDICILTL
jgi:hypothetical protein